VRLAKPTDLPAQYLFREEQSGTGHEFLKQRKMETTRHGDPEGSAIGKQGIPCTTVLKKKTYIYTREVKSCKKDKTAIFNLLKYKLKTATTIMCKLQGGAEFIQIHTI